ncbi:hypothetical protein [Leptolyngbya sp. 7M]|uniref:hypothetical protein n=1 Tax=Leptolyngbya sp. 7M TaxID=2812896 RepID=UPI001B8D8785|nr:hypothetical protein [Leptolyngbya sp. 7M]QYO64114.1 hypothetical protein JVX88_30870 [Leptolyngbya sp. 7M]
MDFEATVFGTGLGLGLLVALGIWLNKWRVNSSLRKELDNMKKHLQTQLSINAKGYEEMQQELKRLKQENENLRITVATLSNKPGRTELRTLQTWDKAVRIMTVNSPGFAPAWEMALAEANKEVQEIDTGMKALVRRVFPMLPQELSSAHSDEINSNN